MSAYKKLTITILVFLFGLLTFSITAKVSALDIISRSQMGIDETLVVQDDNFLQPDSIVITPIFIEGGEYISEYDWYKGLFYYQAVRLNQGDFLFHYIVTKSGLVFKGNAKGEENRIRMTGETSKPIIIAYFSNENDIEFDPVSKTGLSELILDIANRNAIDLDSVYVKSISFVAKQNEAVTAQFGLLGGRWERSLKDITTQLKPLYKPQAKTFDIQIISIELPTSAVNYGDNIVMNITLKNNSDFILLKGNPAEPIMTLSGSTSSKFFLNNIWSSLSQVPVMNDATFLRPGETKTFQVRLGVPLYFGQITEKFNLLDAFGKKYPSSDFDVSLNVNHPSQKVVEVIGVKQLNVHNNPWYNAPVVNRVTLGQRFIVLEETNQGWLKLDLKDGRVGWVVIKYVKTV